MPTPEELERQVQELKQEVASFRAGGARGVRKSASWSLAGLPLYHIAIGPDSSRGEIRGQARGIFAIGDIATGVVAFGGWARGVLAIGGLTTGLIGLGGLSLGVVAAVGGLAIGGLSFGGAAVGGVAVGGGAVGYYACGGAAAGRYVISAARLDPEADAFFARWGVDRMCRPSFGRR